jgi:outer membrane immunogenic protein
MKKLPLAILAAFAAMMASPALAADLTVKAPASFAERFNWTSCYAGVHLGGGFARKDLTDPIQLAQDETLGFGATAAANGVTTVSPNPSGVVAGGQIGCDYQFASSPVVLGVEGAGSGATMKAQKLVGLPLGNPGDAALVQANTDFLPSVTARIGYAIDNVLLYARGGAALAGDKFEVSGTFQGTPIDFRGLDNRWGWTVGGGADWAFSGHWSAFLEYDYYQFGRRNLLMTDPLNAPPLVNSGFMSAGQTVQVVKAGVNFHVWGAGL